jgi:hypothetical protein
MTASEETAFYDVPALPTPGMGARILIAAGIMHLRSQDAPESLVNDWRKQAEEAVVVRSPVSSIVPLLRQ